MPTVCNMTCTYHKVTPDKLEANWIDRYHEGVERFPSVTNKTVKGDSTYHY